MLGYDPFDLFHDLVYLSNLHTGFYFRGYGDLTLVVLCHKLCIQVLGKKE